MKLHFFTVNDIQDYRKNYRTEPLVQKAFEEAHPRKIEELDQAYFFRLAKNIINAPDGIFESKIFGDTGFPGLRLDFNFGLRLSIPEGNFRVKVSDFDTGEIFFNENFSGGRLISVEQYFIRWHVEVFLDDEKIFSHTFNPEGQPVAVVLGTDALGDMLAFLPYLEEFRKIHRCEMRFLPHKTLREFIAQTYPDIELIDQIDFQTYATYYPTMLTNPAPNWPVDTRRMSLTRVGGVLFGINYLPPKGSFKPTEPPVTDEPYVCIALQARNARKSWHWPGGWDIVVDYLKSLGYRVFCIDRKVEENNDGFTVRKPDGAEDFTGNRPLIERANMLYHAEFFIGISSGLSWLADAVGCPVVMICGFTQDWNEFYTPYRVANRRFCNGCANDVRTSFFNKCVCPYHEGTPRELECQKKISPRMVIDAIEKIIVDKKLIPPALKNF